MAKGRRSANTAGWSSELTAKKAVAKLSDTLNTMQRKYARSPEQQRKRLLLALAAGAKFISAVAPEVGHNYLSFHMLLVAAMHDLDKGAVVPMLRPKNIGKGRRVTFSKSQILWHAAATMKSLMGLRLTRPQASKLVANLLSDHGLWKYYASINRRLLRQSKTNLARLVCCWNGTNGTIWTATRVGTHENSTPAIGNLSRYGRPLVSVGTTLGQRRFRLNTPFIRNQISITIATSQSIWIDCNIDGARK